MKKLITIYYSKFDRDNCDFLDMMLESVLKNAFNLVSNNWQDCSIKINKNTFHFINIFMD